MVWATWRQHRGEAIAVTVVGLVLAAAVVITGVQMHSAYDAQGVGGCLVVTQPASCEGVVGAYQQQFQLYIGMYQWLNLLPLALGIFVGAPLVAREVERATHLLVWTQGVTRTRWIVTKVALLGAAAVMAGTAYTLLLTWWRQPLDMIAGSGLAPDAFDLEGVVPLGYFLAALSMGIAAGTLLRRTVPAMGVAIAGFLALRFGTIAVLRPHFMAPLSASASIGAAPPPSSRGAWILEDTLRDPAGNAFNGRFAFDQLCASSSGSKNGLDTCLQQHGIVESLTYQPADRFWPFQLIELGLFLGVSVALIALSVWWVRRRIS
ncbi:MAG: transporter [Candidatus Dormibacteraeota bacterium]|uniref:Transporter n=1 Tax=Candidatus Aeolococcus gillhamiae TaxID=3127015 RepID=A0A934JXI1_9BACT|nr:transporter [Candidatus Dormibacteraeota bacterium]